MAAARLRKTFHYPSSSEDEDAVEEGLDEQDQAQLLSTLSKHDTTTTRTYTYLLLVLPLLPVALYIPLLLRVSTLPAAIAAVASLLATAYTLFYLPLPPIRISLINAADPNSRRAPPPPAERRPAPWISEDLADLLARWIVPANGVLCGVLAAVELLQGRTWSEGVAVGGGFLPGVVMMIVMFARRELRGVDMSELERLAKRT